MRHLTFRKNDCFYNMLVACLPVMLLFITDVKCSIFDSLQQNQNSDKAKSTESEELASQYLTEGLSLLGKSKRNHANARKLMWKAADLGSDDAKVQLGKFYLFNPQSPADTERAFQLFSGTDTAKEPIVLLFLGFMYSNGLGVNSSQYKALIHYTMLADSDHSVGRMLLAYRYLRNVNLLDGCEAALQIYAGVADEVASSIKLSPGPVYQRIRLSDEPQNTASKHGMMIDDEVIQYYQLLAERGDLQAQLGLGELFFTGKRGTQSNFKKSLYYFSKAAENGGSISAISYMGRIYAQGDEHVPKNTNRALKLLRQAAEKGDSQGQSGLALMYYHGIGVTKDLEVALRYFTLAAKQKNIEAFLWLGIMSYNGEGVKKNLATAINYLTLATQGGHVLGPYYLATINSKGPGILRNCETSAELFKTVAERGSWSSLFMDAHSDYKQGRHNAAFLKYLFLAEVGYEDSQLNAAYLLDKGLVTLFDKRDCMKRAFSLYYRAADQGNAFARVRLGDFYYYGMAGMDVDYKAAVSQYKVAVDAFSNAQAMYNLGYMYEMGLGLRQDLHLAKRFYDKASATNSEAILPSSLALLKLKFKFLRHKAPRVSVIKRPLNFVQRMKALRIGTMLSGLIIFLVFFWHRLL